MSLLPPDVVEAQLSAVSLLQAMFPLDGELELGFESVTNIPDLERYAAGTSAELKQSIKALRLVIRVLLEDSERWPVEMEVQLPITRTNDTSITDEEAAFPNIYLRHPGFLSRSAYEDLIQSVNRIPRDYSSAEYVLQVVDHVRTNGPSLLTASPKQDEPAPLENLDIQLERVWFWFPSLSTRSKRKDLVDYAPRYGLTGFVLAGKPGLLCLEGGAKNVDSYMSAIKSDSWSDIPSYQKKVTERHRQQINDRAFSDMQEITDQITQYGRFGNRGEMAEVKQFMDDNGVGDAFAIVVGNGFG